jgi:hypothetical protein
MELAYRKGVEVLYYKDIASAIEGIKSEIECPKGTKAEMAKQRKYAILEAGGKAFAIDCRSTNIGREGARVKRINNDNVVFEIVVQSETGEPIRTNHVAYLRNEEEE